MLRNQARPLCTVLQTHYKDLVRHSTNHCWLCGCSSGSRGFSQTELAALMWPFVLLMCWLSRDSCGQLRAGSRLTRKQSCLSWQTSCEPQKWNSVKRCLSIRKKSKWPCSHSVCFYSPFISESYQVWTGATLILPSGVVWCRNRWSSTWDLLPTVFETDPLRAKSHDVDWFQDMEECITSVFAEAGISSFLRTVQV